MSIDRRVIVLPDKHALAAEAADRFVATTTRLLRERPAVHAVLTGGSVGIAVLAAIAAHDQCTAIDWARVHLWWGDERWVPSGDPERNEGQARAALLDHLAIPAENIHTMPASDSGMTLDEAAAHYRDELLRAGGGAFPVFAITFLGVGPDGHIASLFPERPGPTIAEPDVIAVRDSPKPPPERLSLTLPLLNSSERVWLVLAGADKAAALGLALAGAATADVPVAGVGGRERTVVFIDEAASAEVPESLIAPTEYWTGAMDQPDWQP